MLTAVVVLCLSQAPGQPVKIAVPGLSLSGLETRLGEAYVERFATLLGRDRRLEVTTKRDIEQILGLEREKVLLGCTEGGSSCLAELAGGLGVDAVLSGSLAKTGSSYTVTMRVVRATNGVEIASSSERLKDEDALGEWLEAEAPRLATQIALAFGHPTAPAASPVVRWIPALVGVGLLAAGAGMQVGANLDAASLKAGSVALADTTTVLSRGKTVEAVSWVFIGVGAAAVAASVTWAIVAGGDSAKVAVVPTQGGAFVSIAGVLP